ncbi:MAG TPA: FRG domain-containing protein, partial [Bryobacteraceae bacterium]|nr:FRG domain-containing protein [Bryobacteraceae bacterium]
MIAARITNYSELISSIAALPPASNGQCRVFRGQTTEYPKILSSFARVRGGPAAEVSRVFFQHLFVKQATLSIIGDLKKLDRFNYFDIKVAPENFYLAEALVQHYGYQSRYIDATPSLDVALWFARNRFRSHADEPAGDKPPFRMTFPAWYEPSSDEGVLYVIDVNMWNQKSAISPADYIDLVPIAPEGVNRPRRQTGGVLFAPGLGPDHDDISPFVRAKFTIAFPWGESGKDWDTDYLFPN